MSAVRWYTSSNGFVHTAAASASPVQVQNGIWRAPLYAVSSKAVR